MDMLDIRPDIISFPNKGNGMFLRWKKFDPNVCTIRLINKTRHRAAFKVLTVPFFVKRYIVTPSTGIVEPGSTYEVSVSIQEEEKLASPVEFVAVPKFAIFSTVITEGEDITSETFLNEGGKKVWLKVIDVVHDEQSGMLEVNLRRHGSVLRFLVLVAAVVAVFIGWVIAHNKNDLSQLRFFLKKKLC